mgnify:CR=1 FL=1
MVRSEERRQAIAKVVARTVLEVKAEFLARSLTQSTQEVVESDAPKREDHL